MKIIILTTYILLALSVSVPKITQAQGTTYLSNLGETSTGSSAVGSDSWLAASFFPGTNSTGYVLDSIQLSMNEATGTPSGFTVMLYSVALGSSYPGARLATLSGSPSPSTAGIYTYGAPANVILRFVGCFIVVTAGTPVTSGAYEWSLPNISDYNPIDGWGIPSSTQFLSAADGSHWNPTSGTQPQFAINATPVPEPGTLGLIAFGGLCLIWLKFPGFGLRVFAVSGNTSAQSCCGQDL
jgi:hypothetical protein